jgi:hypothetical protein
MHRLKTIKVVGDTRSDSAPAAAILNSLNCSVIAVKPPDFTKPVVSKA